MLGHAMASVQEAMAFIAVNQAVLVAAAIPLALGLFLIVLRAVFSPIPDIHVEPPTGEEHGSTRRPLPLPPACPPALEPRWPPAPDAPDS